MLNRRSALRMLGLAPAALPVAAIAGAEQGNHSEFWAKHHRAPGRFVAEAYAKEYPGYSAVSGANAKVFLDGESVGKTHRVIAVNEIDGYLICWDLDPKPGEVWHSADYGQKVSIAVDLDRKKVVRGDVYAQFG